MHCKAGDLAVVIRSRHPESLGAIVEVVRPFGHRLHGGSDPMWWVRATGRVLKGIGGFTGEHVSCREGGIEDRHLRPVSGLAESDLREEALVV